MNSKLLICVFALFALAMADGPFCSLCEKMIDDVKVKYNNDFSNVTPAQLEASMDAECAANTSGIQTSMCKNIVKQDNAKLLAALKAGKDSKSCCVDGSLC